VVVDKGMAKGRQSVQSDRSSVAGGCTSAIAGECVTAVKVDWWVDKCAFGVVLGYAGVAQEFFIWSYFRPCSGAIESVWISQGI